MIEQVVSMHGVTKTLNGYKVLNDVTMRISSGEVCGLTGPNGSGKSMLLKAICGLIEVDRGEISVFGEMVSPMKMAAHTGALIELPGLELGLSAYENLILLARSKEDLTLIPATLNALGIDPQDRRPVRRYSLGMKQKLAIAQAIFDRPRLLLLDEPTSNLDKKSCNELVKLISSLNSRSATTMLIASHHYEFLDLVCNRCYSMDSGCIRES